MRDLLVELDKHLEERTSLISSINKLTKNYAKSTKSDEMKQEVVIAINVIKLKTNACRAALQNVILQLAPHQKELSRLQQLQKQLEKQQEQELQQKLQQLQLQLEPNAQQ